MVAGRAAVDEAVQVAGQVKGYLRQARTDNLTIRAQFLAESERQARRLVALLARIRTDGPVIARASETR